MTTLPSSYPATSCSQIISRVRRDTSPMYTPARTSSNQIAKRPRKRDGTFSVTTVRKAMRPLALNAVASLTQAGRVGNGGRHRLNRRFGRLHSPGSQHLFDGGDDLAQQLAATKQVAAALTNHALRKLRRLGRDLEGQGHHSIELEQVSHVVDKRQGLARVDEPNGRGITGGQHRRLSDAIQAGRGRRQAAVGDVGRIPGLLVVVTGSPAHAVLPGQQ